VANELRVFEDSKFNIASNLMISDSVAKDPSQVQKINLDKNSITLNSGREIEYDTMILDNGFDSTLDNVPGLVEALNDPNGRVYTTSNQTANKMPFGFFPLFQNGDAYIYIPKFPFENEVSQYNFLMALSVWDHSEKLGIISPIRKLTIINANDRFASKCDVLNDFITKRLQNFSKVEVLYNTELTDIKGRDRKLTMKDAQGAEKEVEFDRLYVHEAARPSKMLTESGILKDGEMQISVRPTLQHLDHDNVFCFGDMIKTRVQNSFLSTISQSHTVRHNALEMLAGRSANHQWENYTSLPLFTAHNSAVFYTNKGDIPSITSSVMEPLMYQYIMKSWKGFIDNIHKGKKAGPPGSFKHPKFPKGDQVREPIPEHH